MPQTHTAGTNQDDVAELYLRFLRRFLGHDVQYFAAVEPSGGWPRTFIAMRGTLSRTELRNPRPGLRPGHCKGKAHRREHLGYAGRRVLVSRKWSG